MLNLSTDNRIKCKNQVINLKEKHQKILQVSKLNNGSILILSIVYGKTRILSHLTNTSSDSIQKSLTLKDELDQFVIFDDTTVIIPELSKNTITFWNVQRCTTFNLQFQYKAEQMNQIKVFYFQETNIICLVQTLAYYSEKGVRFSFIKSRINQQKLNQFYLFDTIQVKGKWLEKHLIAKANNLSLMSWFQHKLSQDFTFHTRNVFSNQTISYPVPNLRDSIIKQFNIHSETIILIQEIRQISIQKFLIITKNIKQGTSYFLIYHSKNKTLKKPKFNQSKFNCYQNIIHFQKFMIIRTSTSYFYINCSSQQIVYQQQLANDVIQSNNQGAIYKNYYFTDENFHTYNQSLLEFKIFQIRFMVADRYDNSVYLLTQIIPNVSDDLVQAVSELLNQ